jgi:hypothetical protein
MLAKATSSTPAYEIRPAACDINLYQLEPAEKVIFAAVTAGAHIDLQWANGRIWQRRPVASASEPCRSTNISSVIIGDKICDAQDRLCCETRRL